jgi:thiazole synthase ThiGH ThiG subunit
MAVNQTDVALNACSKIVDGVGRLLKAVDDLEAIAEQISKSNITLSAFDAGIGNGSGICQASGVTYQAVLMDVQPEIVRALKAFTSTVESGVKGWVLLQKVRP